MKEILRQRVVVHDRATQNLGFSPLVGVKSRDEENRRGGGQMTARMQLGAVACGDAWRLLGKIFLRPTGRKIKGRDRR